jgi:hypothetical protein
MHVNISPEEGKKKTTRTRTVPRTSHIAVRIDLLDRIICKRISAPTLYAELDAAQGESSRATCRCTFLDGQAS